MGSSITIREAARQYVAHYRACRTGRTSGVTRVAGSLRWLVNAPLPDQYAAAPDSLFESPSRSRRVGDLPLSEVNRRLLRHVRDTIDASGRVNRQTLNDYVAEMQRMIRWAIDRDMVAEADEDRVLGALIVRGLRAGQSLSREPRRVVSPPPADVDRFIAEARRILAVMVHVQRWTGMRSQNLVGMRLREIDRSADIWLYEPDEHKTSWRGKRLVIPIGAQAQAALSPWIEQHPQADQLFIGPRGSRYSSDSYRTAIRREQKRLDMPHWTPHQLRHEYSTRVARTAGRDAAQILLGHSSPQVTERYIDPARRDEIIELARAIE